jgi:hypothetical protein
MTRFEVNGEERVWYLGSDASSHKSSLASSPRYYTKLCSTRKLFVPLMLVPSKFNPMRAVV